VRNYADVMEVVLCLAIRYVHPSQPGFVLAVGEGDTGQLGLGPDIMDRSKPARVDLPADAIQICAGGMHSVCLTVGGQVSVFLLSYIFLFQVVVRCVFALVPVCSWHLIVFNR